MHLKIHFTFIIIIINIYRVVNMVTNNILYYITLHYIIRVLIEKSVLYFNNVLIFSTSFNNNSLLDNEKLLNKTNYDYILLIPVVNNKNIIKM